LLKKILVGLLVVLVVLFAGTMLMFRWFMTGNDQPKGSQPVVLEQSDAAAPQALVVFQPSRTDITETAAMGIARGLHNAGFRVVVDHPGEHIAGDMSAYTVAVFGTPAYVGTPSGVILSVLTRIESADQTRIALFSTGSVMETWVEMDTMKSSLAPWTAMATQKFSANQKGQIPDLAEAFGAALAKP